MKTNEQTDPPPQTTTKKLNQVSEEQQHIINLILQGDNVFVDACAGSGKSTTILSTALKVPHLKMLQMTYNAELRKDVKKQIQELEIRNVNVHTFHSLAVKYYLPNAHTDTGIRKIILDNLPPNQTIPQFDIIVLDEAQDITYLYYQLMVKFSLDMGRPFQLFLLGDYMQGIYEFKGADIRFLTLCEHIWNTHSLLKSNTFHKCTLQTSYRITHQMAHFVNNAMLGTTRLIANKEGSPVMYIRNSRKNLEKVVIFQIRNLISNGVCPSDIFVLGASVKGVSSNIRKMENALVENGIHCHVPMLETEKLDERVIQGKVVFSTFHSVKGRQRKYVFITGFDQSYFNHYAKNLKPDICPNPLYVGCTRATTQMFLLESDNYSTDRPLDFLKMNHYTMKQQTYIEFRGHPRSIFYEKIENEKGGSSSQPDYQSTTPTDLIKFVSEQVIEEISPLLDKIFINETPSLKPEDELPIPNVVETSPDQYEDVSDINGIAIPSIYYDYITNKYNEILQTDVSLTDISGGSYETSSSYVPIGANILRDVIDESMENTRENDYLFLKQIIRDLPAQCHSPSDYLYLSNVYISSREKLYFRLHQIQRHQYNWLPDDLIQKCLERLDNIINIKNKPSSQLLVEYRLIHYDMEEETKKINEILGPHFPCGKKFKFSARADLITEKHIWELKCTSTISIEHRLQLVIYDWLWRALHSENSLKHPHKKYIRKPSKMKTAKIVNIKTGEMLRIDASFDELTQIVVALLKGKYVQYEEKNDEEFISHCLQYLHTKQTLAYDFTK